MLGVVPLTIVFDMLPFHYENRYEMYVSQEMWTLSPFEACESSKSHVLRYALASIMTAFVFPSLHRSILTTMALNSSRSFRVPPMLL